MDGSKYMDWEDSAQKLPFEDKEEEERKQWDNYIDEQRRTFKTGPGKAMLDAAQEVLGTPPPREQKAQAFQMEVERNEPEKEESGGLTRPEYNPALPMRDRVDQLDKYVGQWLGKKAKSDPLAFGWLDRMPFTDDDFGLRGGGRRAAPTLLASSRDPDERKPKRQKFAIDRVEDDEESRGVVPTIPYPGSLKVIGGKDPREPQSSGRKRAIRYPPEVPYSDGNRVISIERGRVHITDTLPVQRRDKARKFHGKLLDELAQDKAQKNADKQLKRWRPWQHVQPVKPMEELGPAYDAIDEERRKKWFDRIRIDSYPIIRF